MASIRKRQWFTPSDRKKIEPVAKQLASAAGQPGKWGHFSFQKQAADSLGIKPSVSWLVAYKDRSGRAFKQFATKQEAEDWKITAQHEIKQGTHTRTSASKTIAEAWALWLEHCEAEKLEIYTIEQRQQHLNHHVKPFIGDVKLSDLTTPMVYDFDRTLRQQGRSLSMRRKVITNLKTMLSYAQGHGPLVAQNVARGVKIKKDEREEATGPVRAGVDFPSMPELNQLIENSTGRWRPLIVTAIFTGMRASELRGLPWRDVDLDAGVVHVRQRADKGGNIGPPKSKRGKRDIPLPPIVVNALRQWQSECPKGELCLVFPNGQGNVEGLSNIYDRFWQPLQFKLGLTTDIQDGAGKPIAVHRYGFHMLRHAAASLFIRYLGWSPKRLQTVMGHSSINMTFDLYGHLFEDVKADREDMEKIEAAVRAA
jgi:integrase